MKKMFLLLFCFAAMYLIPLGVRPLVVPDEFRYAQIPLEMLKTGNFSAPQMFGHPYFEKPVMGHWLNAAGLYIFGCNNFAIRLSSALCTGLTALLVGLMIFSTFRDRRFAALGTVMYLGCAMVYGMGVFAVLDAPMVFFSTGAMFCAFACLQENRTKLSKILLMILCGIFCGLGFMTKGVPALIAPGLGTAGFLLWQKRWKEFFIMPGVIIPFMVLTVLPWAWAVHQADGDFWRYFVVVEHIERFTKGGVGQHPEPWYFLLPFFFGGAFPAAFLLFSGWGNTRKIIRQMAGVPLHRFAFCSAVLPLILFSCSGGKLPTYILPCFPGIAVLMAGFVVTALRNYEKSETNLRRLFSCFGYFFTIVGILAVPAGYVMRFYFDRPLFTAVSHAVLAAGASFAAGGILLLLSEKRNIRDRLCFFVLLFVLPTLVIPFFISADIKPNKMPGPAFREIREIFRVAPENVHIVTSASFMHAAAWVFETSDVQTLNSVGEMDYADERARKEKRRPMGISTAEFNRYLKQKDRKDVIYIFRTGKGVRLRGVKPQNEFTGTAVSARYYPGRKSSAASKGAEVKK